MVTGAGRGIGGAIALELARSGADLALHYRSSAEGARSVGDRITAMGRRAELFQADLARADEIAGLFDAVARSFAHLDVLVNNAAAYHRTPIETLSADQWDSEFAINARAAALCISAAVSLMRGRGGAIVNIVDVAGEVGRAKYPAYCASKAALLSLTKSAAKALAPDIRVNAVSPGIALFPDDASEQYKQMILKLIPMRRSGSPEDVAKAVVFLAQHPYITAQNLRVDGGWCMR